jgi:hypothetical protein
MATISTLKIEHPVVDFATWKTAFERDPIGRERAGVLAYRVSRPLDDPKYVFLDLDFDSVEHARAFLARLEQEVWARREVSPGLDRSAVPGGQSPPRGRVVEEVERHAY